MKWKKNGQKPIWSESERKRRTKDCFESQSQQRQTVKIATVSLTHLKLGVVQMRRCFFVFFRKCAVMISQIHATTISVAVPITWDEKSSGRSIDRSAQSVLSHFEFYTHTAAANHIVIMCRYINTCETVIRHYVIQSQRVFKWHGICAFSITPYTQMLSNRCIESFCFLCCLCVSVFFFHFQLVMNGPIHYDPNGSFPVSLFSSCMKNHHQLFNWLLRSPTHTLCDIMKTKQIAQIWSDRQEPAHIKFDRRTVLD